MDEQHSSVPYGYCHCGCGELAPIAGKAYIAKGLKKGDPFKYIQGHNGRKSPIDYLEQDLGHSTPCWIWQQGVISTGYGLLRNPNTREKTLAHRYYYEQKYGLIPKSVQLDHLCRNRTCVNPDHIELVTPAVNVRRGLAAKLTPEKAREIRRLHGQGLSYQQIATRFKVHKETIAAVVKRRTWRDV